MDHAPDTDTGQHMACPECGEPVIPAARLTRRPDIHLPAGLRPAWVHTDGEPLCPVIGPDGYEPAQPVPAVPAAEATQAAEARGAGQAVSADPAAEAAEAAQVTDTHGAGPGPDTYTIEVCDDCAHVIANGEINDGTDRGQEIAAAQTRLWGADAVNLVLACGGDECDTAFSWKPCDGCGSTLGGNRHPASVRTSTAAEAAQAAQDPADGSRLVCPGCGQPVQPHPRWREEPGLYTTLGINRDRIHPDGSPLCSMPGVHGYRPARPVPAAAAGVDSQRCAVMPAGEVAGLEDAIAFGEAMEQRLRQAAIATEQSLANLAAAGVTGDTVTALTSATDTLAGAVMAFSSVTQGLRRQLLVRDAYHAAPGAGDRDFLTRE